jgi:hypothetical protein
MPLTAPSRREKKFSRKNGRENKKENKREISDYEKTSSAS